jgi:hypothetical protein
VDVDVHPVAVDIETELNVVREPDLQFDRVPVLMFFDFDSACADFVVLSGDLGFDGVLVPSVDVDIGVGSFDSQIRFAGDGVGFRPVLGVGERGHGQAQYD